MTRARLLLALLLMAAASPPPERPPLAPTREVSVLYRLLALDKPQTEIRITTRPGAQGIVRRIDLPDQSYLLIDHRKHSVDMVVPAEGTVLDVPWATGLGDQFTLNDRMRFTRRHPATVAKQRCTVWDVVQDTQRGQLCITDDGVMLFTEGIDAQGRHIAIEAVSVTYTPAPQADFLTPPDVERVVPGSRDPAG